MQGSKKVHADGEIRQQGDQHDQARKNGQEKTECHTVGPGQERVLIDFIVNKQHQIIQGDAVEPRHGVCFGPFYKPQPQRVVGKIMEDALKEVEATQGGGLVTDP